ncbi:MAG: DUF2127 domain-containing protein [Chloroflexi bacterium]|nr:DUF2127 domain-containing protein [Chloroflexota bacterium]
MAGIPRRETGILLIIAQKTVWAAGLLIIAFVLLKLRAYGATDPISKIFAGELSEDPHDFLVNLLLDLIPQLSLNAELILGIAALSYAALELFESYGLWRRWTWVEGIIIVEFAAFLPYDLWELVVHFSLLKVGTLLLNLLIVAYLVVRHIRRRQLRERQSAGQVSMSVEKGFD